MFKSKIYLVTVFMMTGTSLAFAGAVSGGGAKSIVCRDAQGKINSAETLDLYEAKNIYGLQLKAFTGSLDQVISSLQMDLKNTMSQPEIHLFPLFNQVRKIMKLIPPTVVLKPVDDAAEVVLSSGCNLEQLAHYVDDDLLLVSEEIWNALSLIDKAALIAHEAIYRMERQGGAVNSRRTRKIVGHLFSGFPFEQVRSGLPAHKKLCMATQGDKVTFQFAYFPSSSGNMTILQFFWYEGKAVFSKKTVIVPIKLPWIQNIPAICDDQGNSCNFSGGEIDSNFEGSGFLTLGIEQHVSPEIVETKLYFLTDTGKHYLHCSP